MLLVHSGETKTNNSYFALHGMVVMVHQSSSAEWVVSYRLGTGRLRRVHIILAADGTVGAAQMVLSRPMEGNTRLVHSLGSLLRKPF